MCIRDSGNVIGYVKDLKVEDGEVTGELMFDEASELSTRCKKQYEFGSLKTVSYTHLNLLASLQFRIVAYLLRCLRHDLQRIFAYDHSGVLFRYKHSKPPS